MQRQNELDGMINTTGTTFLGLTLGCARCHDHKFDPVTQRDYYSLQAIFAGVNHAERMIDQKREPALAMEQATLESRVDSAKKELTLLEARIPRFKPPVNARGNEEIFDPVQARFIRFNIVRANQSEPCVDELEIFAEGKNVALASAGSKATASGVYLDGSNPIHQLELGLCLVAGRRPVGGARNGPPLAGLRRDFKCVLDGQSIVVVAFAVARPFDAADGRRFGQLDLHPGVAAAVCWPTA